MHGNLAKLDADPKAAEFQFEREDWTLFRSVGTLSQKAGVPQSKLRRLVLKELADNALDAIATSGTGRRVTVGKTDGGGYYVQDDGPGLDVYYVQDDGPGLDGEPEDIARLFSINRPLMSSKLWRVPSRGALGNGLRVVVGAVAASDGRLRVWTRNRRLVLTPQDDGSTAVQAFEADFPEGTRIEVAFGPALPDDINATLWAHWAIAMAHGGESYKGKPSPWWFDGDAFYEMLKGAGERPVRDLIANLDGCSGAKAGEIAASFKNTACNTLNRPQAVELLEAARASAKTVRPERLGRVGADRFHAMSHAIKTGTFVAGGRSPVAEIPFVVEVWAKVQRSTETRARVIFLVNRTPVTGDVRAYGEKGKLSFYGCGLDSMDDVDVRRGVHDITVNVITPYCPITTDGKEPDLETFSEEIAEAIKSATGKARRALPSEVENGSERLTQKDVILENLDEAVASVSTNGEYRFSQRDLYYQMRPIVIEALGAALNMNYFTKVITDYENEHGDVPGMTRDSRGLIYHPHTGETVPLGTLAVERYGRPEWTFNKVLFIEKEGAFDALIEARWPERHDCALLTSKGFTTRAVRDLVDLLARSSEPITVFCAHDADAHGGMIYQTLQEETKARPRRLVEIVNIGLEPWEGLEMGLSVEPVIKEKEMDIRIADYVLDRPDGEKWAEWLKDKRIELNALKGTARFIAWLDGKMAEHETAKLIPPSTVIDTAIAKTVPAKVRSVIAERILREARIDERVAAAMATIQLPSGDDVGEEIEEWFDDNEDARWSDYIDSVADMVVEDANL